MPTAEPDLDLLMKVAITDAIDDMFLARVAGKLGLDRE